MITKLPTYLVAAALVSGPTIAVADFCSPDKRYMKHSYYNHPHPHRYYHPMHGRMFHQGYPGPYWHGDKSRGGNHHGDATGDKKPSEQGSEAAADIIDTAINAGSFNTLVEALKSTGLDETLQGPGPYTVFAPSDEAFGKLPDSIRAAITNDRQALTELLSYHVVSGEVTAFDVARLNSAETVQGSAITIETSNGVKVDGANVVTADIRANNGIIHVIDAVMIPN